MSEKIKKLEERLGYKFLDKNLIIEALTHKSYKKPYNNERLEFLGDAVLDLIIGEYLFSKFPTSNEGELSKLRASLVNEKGFMKLAIELDLGNYIYISAAEENNKGRAKPSLLSNAFESIMGAIYLEKGLDEVRGIVHKLLEKVYPVIDLEALFKDYKTTLQELTQARFNQTPEYKVVDSFGPDHKKEFIISVEIDGKEYGKARGGSKKQAQQNVAKIALSTLNSQKL